jgi:hypothetical protein
LFERIISIAKAKIATLATQVNTKDIFLGSLLLVNFEAKRGSNIATRNEAKPNGNRISNIKMPLLWRINRWHCLLERLDEAD